MGIIGVVAALTLPSLIANKQEKELIVAWKKAFSDMSNAALLMSQYDEDLSSEQKIGEAFSKYMKVEKVCEANKDVAQGCWKANTPIYKYGTKQIHSHSIGQIGAGSVCMRTVSGGVFCIDNGGVNSILIYDVNGTKKPNEVGKDIFATLFNANSYMVKPAKGTHTGWGAADGHFISLTVGDGTCGSDEAGYACSAEKLLK